MANQRSVAKEATRLRISETATALILEHGFDAVTVNDVAARAGVSKVTVFAHFPRKEDLLLDRGPEAARLLTDAIVDRPASQSPVRALRTLAEGLAHDKHQLSGLAPGTKKFLAAVAGSPTLLARALELSTDLENTVAAAIRDRDDSPTDADLIAALSIAAYRTVLIATARRVLAGETKDVVVRSHRQHLATAFDAVEAAEARIGSLHRHQPAE